MASTIVDLLRARAEERGDVIAYRYLRDGESAEDVRTWAEMDRRARAIGTTLRGMGAAGTNVLMLYPPGIDFIEGYFGCLYAGATPVPAYPPEPARLARTLPRVQAIVADAKPRLAMTTRPLLALADFVFAQAPDLRTLEWVATDAIDGNSGDNWARPAISGDTFAMLQYTSGSTGTQKGVMLSHANLLANAACVFAAFEFEPDDRILSWLPMFHDMGFMSGVLQPLYSGCPVVGLSPIAFLEKPYRWVAAIHASRITVCGGPNFAYDLVVRKTTAEQRAALDLSCWKLAYNGAEAIRLETIDRFAAAFAVSKFQRNAMFPCYGLAEATLIVSGTERAAAPVAQTFDKAALEAGLVKSARVGEGQMLVASGKASPGQTIAIVDPDTGVRCPPDRVGEIWVAGDSVGHGYWMRVEESAATFVNKLADDPVHTFVRTGDLGFVLDHQLYVCGRAKDLIIVRGTNHYPQDIELTVEQTHPAIRPGCVAAFAVETGAGEERVVVVAEVDRRYHDRDRRRSGRTDVERRSGEPSRRDPDPAAPQRAGDEPLDVDRLFWDLRDAIAARHELEPHAVVLVRAGSIHKTSSGKLQRRACKAAFAANELEVLAEWRADGTKRHSDVASADKSKPTAVPVAPPLASPVAPLPMFEVDLAALRRAAVLVCAVHAETFVRALTEHQLAATVGDAAAAKAGVYAAIVSDDLALLAGLSESPTARLYITAFADPEAVRDALATGVISGVLPAKAGVPQLVAAVSEAVDAWVSHHTDLATGMIENWLAGLLAKRLDINARAIDLDAPLSGHGLDSLTMIEVQTALSEWIRQDVPDTLMRGRSSIRSIARRLTSADSRARVTQQIPVEAGIAIVGIGCAVPGAGDATALWQLVQANTDAITEIPEDRVRGGEGRTRWGGMIEGITDFDAAFFGIAPRDAAHIDPQHRLLLETTWQALEDAGLDPKELAGSDTGVFVGISGSDFIRARPELLLTDRASAAAERLSYFFNLNGPSFAIDSGDNSSLVALHLAIASLQRNECKVAIACGVNLVLTPDLPIAYAKARLLSASGRCRPLDARADGGVLSDGCGAVVLKRLSDARSGRNRIHAEVLATAIRQNGRGHGLTAPNEASQEQVLREAIRLANVRPADIHYAELNARGVPAYDAIEARALASVLGQDRAADAPCVVGSLKANLGDTRSASGLLGVIKAALILAHDEIPPLLHLREINSEVASSLVAPTLPRPWPATGGERRLATINSFGLLGSNAVVVLARDHAPALPVTAAPNPVTGHVLTISARSEDALRTLADRYATRLASTPASELAAVCFPAHLGRAAFAQRAAIVAGSPGAMRDQLAAIARGDTASKRAIGRGAARIAFVFTGRGVATARMAHQLFLVEPRFRAVIERCEAALGRSVYEDRWDATHADSAMVAIECALAELWQSWGIYPDFVLGHDVGEYAAAAIAGAITIEDAVMLAAGLAARTPVPSRAPAIPLVSTVTGKRFTGVLDEAYWRRHATEGLKFERGLKELLREGTDVFLEIGPRPVLGRSDETRDTNETTGRGVWLTSLDPDAGADRDQLLASLGKLYERGIAPNWTGFYHGQDRVRVALPSYPFERRRCWPDDSR
ncbi:hypothetical protein BH11MYX1_BH11MYX1_17400 [soil metagenome]